MKIEMKWAIIASLATLVLCLLSVVIIPWFVGYKIYWATSVQYNFEEVTAWGTWAAALIPVPIALLSGYFAFLAKKYKSAADDTQAETSEYISEKLSSSTTVSDEALKEQLYKLVCLNQLYSTKSIAQKAGIEKEKAFELLRELMLVDRKLTCGGRATIDNIDHVVWMRKK